ncbi:MAG: hypothetical protein DMF72_01640 [Acidobacteria bacterium]|nr:MAG: hypothetical protein DMF72_01640 [Acidobacteriota bacterium]
MPENRILLSKRRARLNAEAAKGGKAHMRSLTGRLRSLHGRILTSYSRGHVPQTRLLGRILS